METAKRDYITPLTVCVPVEPGTLLAGSYRPPVDMTTPWTDDEGNEWYCTGYIYEEGHEGDDNYIIDYIFGPGAGARGGGSLWED